MNRRSFIKSSGLGGMMVLVPGVNLGASRVSSSSDKDILSDLRVESCRLVDEQGREVLLRGVNLSGANKHPDSSGSFLPAWLNEKVLDDIAGRGFNSVRLVMVWEAIEPEPGIYNRSYMEQIRHIIHLAHERGIYSILDMHQDLFSRAYQGDGAPAWTLPDRRIPYRSMNPWYINYIRPAVVKAFDRFWRNKDSIQERFRECWRELARNFRSEPGIAGYEILNEPYPASLLFLPDYFDKKALGPFIQNLVEGIREEDSKHPIFFEPSAVRTNVLAPFGFPSSLPADLGENLVFAPHFYDPLVTLTRQWSDNIKRLENAADDLVKETHRLGAALWVGEWGVWDYSVENGEGYLLEQLKIFDQRAVGWSFWDYNLDRPDNAFIPGSPNTWIAETMDRPYPHRTAGQIRSLYFDPSDARFLLVVKGVANVNAPSEIYLPMRIYGEGFTVQVSDYSAWRFDSRPRILKVNAPEDGQIQTIKVLT
jgi:endoglycosylceramidase